MNRIIKYKKNIILLISFIVLLLINNIVNKEIYKNDIKLNQLEQIKIEINSFEDVYIKEKRLKKILNVYIDKIKFIKKNNIYTIKTVKTISKSEFINLLNKITNISTNIKYINIDIEENKYEMEVKI